jgi:cell division protein ZapB
MNKMIPVIALIVILMTAGVAFSLMTRGGSHPEQTPQQQTAKVNAPPPRVMVSEQAAQERRQIAERDNWVETLRTVALNQEQLLNRVNELEKNTETRLVGRIDEQVKARSQSVFSEISQNVDALVSPIREVAQKLEPQAHPKAGTGERGADIPAGLGFDSLPLDGASARTQPGRAAGSGGRTAALAASPSETITIKPTLAGVPDGKTREMLYEDDLIRRQETQSVGVLTPVATDVNPIPYYTIPVTATLFSNTSLTALLGVVPVKGSVRDPIKFKIITGAENIASNGHYLPQIQNIVWSGTAVGNREMSCVTGRLDAVTFTFTDGTIYTQTSTGNTAGLGYISDRWGKPCIPGMLVSNASQYLADRMVVAGVGATAEAAAATQTTTLRDNSGNVVNFVSGESEKYIIGKLASGTLGELASYLKSRQDDAVDIVYVDAGHELVVHVESEITIDYRPTGRKLDHQAQRLALGAAQGQFFD